MPSNDPTPMMPAPAGDVPRLGLSPAEAAKSLGIGRRLLWELTNRKEIPHLRLGRRVVYPVDALQAWLAERVQEDSR